MVSWICVHLEVVVRGGNASFTAAIYTYLSYKYNLPLSQSRNKKSVRNVAAQLLSLAKSEESKRRAQPDGRTSGISTQMECVGGE